MIFKTAHVSRDSVNDFDMGPLETAANYGLALMEGVDDDVVFFGPEDRVDIFVSKFGDEILSTEEVESLDSLMGY